MSPHTPLCLSHTLHTHTHMLHPMPNSLLGIPVSFQEHPNNTTAVVGSSTVLRCRPPTSHPPALIAWKKDGAFVDDDRQSVIILPTGNLYLLNLTKLDAGSYQCVATNPVNGRERKSHEAILTVVGEHLVFSCTRDMPS